MLAIFTFDKNFIHLGVNFNYIHEEQVHRLASYL